MNPGPDPQPLHIRPIMRGHVVRQGASDAGARIGVAAAEPFRLVVIDQDEEEGPTDDATQPSEADA